MTRAFGTLVHRLCLLLLVLMLAACGAQSGNERGPVVLAAASLQEALTEAGEAWAAQGHARPELSFAASSALARQVAQGAPADLFLSADEEWMDALERQNLLRDGTRADLLGNALVLIAPKGGAVKSLSGIGDGRLALADPDAVPAGRYARAALESLGLWAGVSGQVVPAENVRAALALVERGEADLGVVYATDAVASQAVQVVERFPPASHPPIRYPIAILAVSDHPDAAPLRAFLGSEAAKAIFVRHGFEALP